jgi:hypothetical protein
MVDWLLKLGFRIDGTRPLLDVVSIRDPLWQWLRAFVDSGLRRLVELGAMPDDAARQTWEEFLERETNPGTRMTTPLVVQVVAIARI